MRDADAPRRVRAEISGIVQGVGFRPFLHRLAAREQLTGWARNTPAGVELELEGDGAAIGRLVQTVRTAPPPLAVVEDLTVQPLAGRGGYRRVCHSAQHRRGRGHPGRPRPGPLPRLPGGTGRPRRPALPLPLHQLHRLRAAVFDPAGAALRPGQHLDGRVPPVPRLRRRIRRHPQPPLPRPAQLLPRLRAAGLFSGRGGPGTAPATPSRWPSGRWPRGRSWPSRAPAASTWPATPWTPPPWPACAAASTARKSRWRCSAATWTPPGGCAASRRRRPRCCKAPAAPSCCWKSGPPAAPGTPSGSAKTAASASCCPTRRCTCCWRTGPSAARRRWCSPAPTAPAARC